MAIPRLTAAAHAILRAIAEGSPGGTFAGSNAQLIGATGYSPSAVERGLAQLEEHGCIARHVRGKLRQIMLLGGSPASMTVHPCSPAKMGVIPDGEPGCTVKNAGASLRGQGCGGTAASPGGDAGSDALTRGPAPGRAEGISLLPGIKKPASRPGFAGGREEGPGLRLRESAEERAHRLAAAVARAKERGFPWAESLPAMAEEWGVPGAAVLAGLRLALRRYKDEASLRKLRGIVLRLDEEELTRADLIKPPAVREPAAAPAPPKTPEESAAEEAELRAEIAKIRAGIPASTQAKVAEDLERIRAPARAKQPASAPARSREEALRELEARRGAASRTRTR